MIICDQYYFLHTDLQLHPHESESESSDSTDVCIVPNTNSSDSETESSSSETLLDTHQGTSSNETTTTDNSEMEVQEGEANASAQRTNANIMAGTHSNLLKWICIILVRIYFKHKVTKAAILSVCALIAIVLKLIGHPLCSIFPTTLDALFNVVSHSKIQGKLYVVCPNDSCNQLYEENAISSSRKCTHAIFGKQCGYELGYMKNLAFSKTKWVPHKTFYFVPPSVWIQRFMSDPTFCKLINRPASASAIVNDMRDITDGNIWKEFSKNPLFNDKGSNNIGLLLNVDWFKPFDRSEYKVSALMMSVVNLPRSERFKKRWTMVLGIIPGPTEPKGNINTFLSPIIEDLLLLWNGVYIESCGKIVKAALLVVTADMPALRKISQFLGHKADLGCSRCMFKAERDPTKKGASGKMSYYTPVAAQSRTHAQVLDQAKEYQSASSQAAAREIQKKNGVRYSELVHLPYFDMVRMLITDPMHTFYLGMVQNEVKLCLKSLLDDKLAEFNRRLKGIRMPYDLGRLPTGIKSTDGLAGLTAQILHVFMQSHVLLVCYQINSLSPCVCCVR